MKGRPCWISKLAYGLGFQFVAFTSSRESLCVNPR